jgi:heme/copper-type cytochrome/quinol oxidase subunit 3
MANSAQLVLWQGLFYGLGALGLFAIGALPLRTYMIAGKLRAAARPAWQLLTILATAICAVVLASQFLLQLAKCLLGYHCSANAAGGWINAAFLGAIYVFFELVAFIVLWVAGHRRVAT